MGIIFITELDWPTSAQKLYMPSHTLSTRCENVAQSFGYVVFGGNVLLGGTLFTW